MIFSESPTGPTTFRNGCRGGIQRTLWMDHQKIARRMMQQKPLKGDGKDSVKKQFGGKLTLTRRRLGFDKSIAAFSCPSLTPVLALG